MKAFIKLIALLLCPAILIAPPASEASTWSTQEGLAAFAQLREVAAQGEESVYDLDEVVGVLAEIYSSMDVSDFNEVMYSLLDTYQAEPLARPLIYRLLSSTADILTVELDEQERNNLALSSTDWALNGAFLLASVQMLARLKRPNFLRKLMSSPLSGFRKGKGTGKGSAANQGPRSGDSSSVSPTPGSKGKTSSETSENVGKGGGTTSTAPALRKKKRFPFSFFEHLKNTLTRHLQRPWKQYAAAAVAGGVIGTGFFLHDKFNHRIHPKKAVVGINMMLLLSAAARVEEIAAHMDTEEALSAAKRENLREKFDHIRETVLLLSDIDPYVRNGITSEEIRTAGKLLEKLFGEERGKFFESIGEGTLLPAALLYQIRTLEARLKMDELRKMRIKSAHMLIDNHP